MSLLLDTQVLLWYLGHSERIGQRARRRIDQASAVVFVSVVSVWEIEIKRALGKLRAPNDLEQSLAEKRFSELSLRLTHVAELASLPSLHRDPFDRMLVAQARAEQLTLVTADEQIRRYDVKTLTAH
jgi:PIN domain nuclease of toxin-antitoxin system